MAEDISDIAKSIQRHRELELSSEIQETAAAVGRSMTLYNGKEFQFWFVNKEAVQRKNLDFNGSIIVDSISIDNKPLVGDGQSVPKNSPLGGLLIMNHEGRHKYQTPKGEIEIEVFNRASYRPSRIDSELATDILIRIAGDSRTHSFQDIAKILLLQVEIDDVEELLRNETDEAAATELRQRIIDKVKEQKIYLDKAQSFVRKYAELRYQPILDPIQEAIKRSKIFDGALVINGGPGTGKTTSLIQRIKFLISQTIEDFITLTKSQKDILFNQRTSWIFYSPNELLALFLRNSMKLEELTADTERVKVWSSHKNELVKTYRFVSETKRPFLIYNKFAGINLFTNNAKSISSIQKGLESSYISFQKDKLNKVAEIDVAPFNWKNVGKSIQNYIKDKSNVKSIEELIRLYLNLTSEFQKEADRNAEEYKTLIEEVASRIQVIIQKDTERALALPVFLKQWKIDTTETDEDEDETDIELEDFDEKEEQTTFDFEKELFTKLKSLCRKQALRKFDKNTRFSKRDRELLAIIPEVNEQKEYDLLGQTAFFKKFFERITKGVVANILREIPLIYKKYRREQLNSNTTSWNLTILEELVKKDSNSRIHPDEQALLLSFVNSVVLKIFKTSQAQYNTINHPFINGFKNNCKPVIGIDEATDFSIIDLVAVNSFGHPEISSITLSGDLMQRMNTGGLTSWRDFTDVIPNSEIKDLTVSYRQSPTLLSLARAIYQKSTGQTANYESFISASEEEPKPLMLISLDEDEKINWIASRILEIYTRYKEIHTFPSIAIFLPEENQLETFATKLGGLDALADLGILVKACRDGQVLGDTYTVRVFSIKVIKGLEFEAVFFHNIDELQEQKIDSDLFLKYLYVGLSRATFYLGITASTRPPEIGDLFDDSGQDWKL
jgi:hypothetical protein